ncbi:hypothetical protein SY85_05170 [Flavisolibacter tropicus]|uniref:Uncharacterized protein n=1 Tax=Flavisolibacter tropicus TaxID=1492898 RepID=A0A172TSB6_9BACT|nr:hypothetical protein SY85_05170 [Flavisolibacter tropicus]
MYHTDARYHDLTLNSYTYSLLRVLGTFVSGSIFFLLTKGASKRLSYKEIKKGLEKKPLTFVLEKPCGVGRFSMLAFVAFTKLQRSLHL